MAEAERLIPNARHEHTDIGEGFVWGAAAVLSGLVLGCALLVLWLYPRTLTDDALRAPLPLYPAPRLQPRPSAEMSAFYAQEMQQLNTAGWVDQEKGIVHIPIADAMQTVAHEGIPGWPTAAHP